MEKQRLKRVKSYYKFYGRGDVLYNGKLEKFVVLGKYQLDDQYYFIVIKANGELLLEKIVYNGSVDIVGVSKEGRQYLQNKNSFDYWFEEAKAKRDKWICTYYNWKEIGNTIKSNYILALKKEYNGEYYFVLRNNLGKHIVAKLGWYTDIQVRQISAKEFDENKSMFYAWINEAKSNHK